MTKADSDLAEVPNDIAKQQISLLLGEKFNQALVKAFNLAEEKKKNPKAEYSLYLKYIQPYLAVPLFKEDKNFIFELELFQNQ